MSWILKNIQQPVVVYGILAATAIALIMYGTHYSSIEGFQTTAVYPSCSDGFTPDGKGSCIGYVCHGGPEKKRKDGTNTCSLPAGKTTAATLTKHPMICGKGYATVTKSGTTTCVKV